jgi:hypothetical protein
MVNYLRFCLIHEGLTAEEIRILEESGRTDS